MLLEDCSPVLSVPAELSCVLRDVDACTPQKAPAGLLVTDCRRKQLTTQCCFKQNVMNELLTLRQELPFKYHEKLLTFLQHFPLYDLLCLL